MELEEGRTRGGDGNFDSLDLVSQTPGRLPPLRNAHVPSVLQSLTESSESASLPSADTYLSIFISSKQAQQYSSIPKYACNLLTVILVMAKLSRHNRFITWFLAILPLFISNTITFCERLSEVHFVLVTQEQDEFSFQRAFRPIASIIDILGSFYMKIVLCIYLSYGYSISLSDISLLIPLWSSFAFATLLRFTAKNPTSESNRPGRQVINTQTRLVLLFGLIFLFLQRVAQPLLIVLKLTDKLSDRTHWSIVFGPSWVTLFFVLACSLLLLSFAPLISSHGNQSLRETTKVLIYLLASRLAVGAICSIIFLVLLSERLDYEFSNVHGSEVKINRILLPLIVFFLFLILVQPLVMQTTIKYQEILAAMVLQRQNRPGSGASSDSSSSASVFAEKHKRNMYFLQISPTLYALCDAHGNSITLQPSKSVPQKIKELYKTFFPTKRKPRINTTNSSSSTYSEVNQSQHRNQAIELSTFSSSSNPEDFHGSYLEDDGKEDDEEESCVILHSKELEQEMQLISRGMEEQNAESTSPGQTSSSSFQYTQCVVCLNNIANGIIYDCGHAVTCLPCGVSLARKPPGHCPICRATITSLLEMSTKPFPLDSHKVLVISRCGYTFHTNDSRAPTGHLQHHSLLAMPHRQLLPTNGHMITNTISNFAANQSLNTQQDSILDILMN